MTSTQDRTASERPRWRVPRPSTDDRIVAGVAAGIAAEIGVEPIVIRAAFVVLAAAGGWGIVLYLAAWGLMSWNAANEPPPSTPPIPKGRTESTRLLGVGLVVFGLLLIIRQLDIGFADALVWPLSLLALGAVFAWHRGVLDTETDPNRRWVALARIGIGLALVVAGIVVLLSSNLDATAARNGFVAAVVVAVGVGLVVGPWAWQLMTTLADERRRRIRSEERTEMATHLHDSVLQTLALIQRNPDDASTLARRQERELRDWLFTDRDDDTPDGVTLRRALADVAGEVEALHHVPIEVVVVGDARVTSAMDALLGASREAMVNAAKHAGAPRIDVFAEVEPEQATVFVRDTGTGFDVTIVEPDRVGIAESISARMARAGGTATIESEPGAGTEVILGLPIADDQGAAP